MTCGIQTQTKEHILCLFITLKVCTYLGSRLKLLVLCEENTCTGYASLGLSTEHERRFTTVIHEVILFLRSLLFVAPTMFVFRSS